MEARARTPRRGLPLRRRLILSSLIGTVPLLLLGIVLLVYQYYARRALVRENNLEQARLTAVYVDGWVTGHIGTLRTLASSSEVRGGTPADLQAMIARQLAAQPEWDNILITDAAGNVLVSGRPQTAAISIGDRAFFQRSKRTLEPAVSNLLVGRITGRKLVTIAYPIVRNRRFAGAIVASVLPERLQQAFSRIPQVDGGYISLWDSNRFLIARSNLSTRSLGRQYRGRYVDVALSQQTGTAVAANPVTGREVFMAHTPVPGTPWHAVSGIPVGTAFAPVYSIIAIFVPIAAAVILLTLLWAFYSANAVARQVGVLAEGAHSIGAGDLDTRVDLPVGGELEDLANSINKMAADLQMTDRLKSDLLSMVSHELKTPLTSIRTSVELLASGAIAVDDPRYQELLGIAERQARRLQDMIENLLNVARLESGSFTVSPRPAVLASIIRSSVAQYEGMAHERGLYLTVDVPSEILVKADVPRITLVMNNLLDNAVKFTEEGGIAVQAEARGSEAVVTVTDTGIGLTPEVRARLFQRFYQAEPLLTRRAGGAGLGLLVVKTIIEAHGGHVFVHSEGPGRGSTFGFTLPLAEQAAS